MSSPARTIRSYQRIFRPDRRIYSIDGRRLPVPGGIPLRWLGWAGGGLTAVLLLSGRSPLLIALLAIAGGAAGRRLGGLRLALAAAVVVPLAAWLLGSALALLGWALRLLIVPGLVATLATQATPDGRPVHRFALSWLLLRVAARRTSLGRHLPAAGRAQRVSAGLRVAPDEHAFALRRGRVRGPAVLRLAAPASVRRGRVRRGRLVVRPLEREGWRVRRAGGALLDSVELRAGEVAELRP